LILARRYSEAIPWLDKCIHFASTEDGHGHGHERVLRRALCQRGMVRALVSASLHDTSNGGTNDTINDACNDTNDTSNDNDTTTIPQSSHQDFLRAAALGDPFAKRELVRSNAYAKMCHVVVLREMARVCGGASKGGQVGECGC
jgi:uncharacterized protein YcgI (DUF1989 family)